MVQEYVDENLQNFLTQFKGKLGCQKQLRETKRKSSYNRNSFLNSTHQNLHTQFDTTLIMC